MYLNREITACLQIIMENKGCLTASDLIKYLDVSKSTAYDLLSDCTRYLEQNHFSFYRFKSKSLLKIEQSLLPDVQSILDNVRPVQYDYSSYERRLYTLFRLLEAGIVKNQTLCEILRISRNTCINDIIAINELLKENGFDVSVVSSVNGYSLGGHEKEIRRVVYWAVMRLTNGAAEDLGLMLRIPGKHRYELYGFDNEALLVPVQKLARAAEILNFWFGYQSANTTACLYYIVLSRVQNGCHILPQEADDRSDAHTNRNLKWILLEAFENELLQDVIYADDTIPQSEKEQIAQLENEELCRMAICAASVHEEYPEHYCLDDIDFDRNSRVIVEYFSAVMGSIGSDKTLVFHSVSQILEGMRFRTLFGYSFSMPDLSAFRLNYNYVCNLTNKMLRTVHQLRTMPVWEIDYLTFQLVGLFVHEISDVNTESACDAPKRIAVVCANNVGTGALIKQQLDVLYSSAETKLIPPTNIAGAKDFDLIVSPLDAQASAIPFIKVHPFLTQLDKRAIENVLSESGRINDLTESLLKDIAESACDIAGQEASETLMDRIRTIFTLYNIKVINKRGYMLNDLISIDRIQCVEAVDDWRTALQLAAQPLIKDGSVEPRYIDAMIGMVDQFGPYFILSPGIALPHARPEDGVNKLAMAVLKVNKPVYFDDGNANHYANLFFVLASADGKAHLNALRQLSQIFMEDGVIERFISAEDKQALFNLLK